MNPLIENVILAWLKWYTQDHQSASKSDVKYTTNCAFADMPFLKGTNTPFYLVEELIKENL